jgi:hypothetical protein
VLRDTDFWRTLSLIAGQISRSTKPVGQGNLDTHNLRFFLGILHELASVGVQDFQDFAGFPGFASAAYATALIPPEALYAPVRYDQGHAKLRPGTPITSQTRRSV